MQLLKNLVRIITQIKLCLQEFFCFFFKLWKYPVKTLLEPQSPLKSDDMLCVLKSDNYVIIRTEQFGRQYLRLLQDLNKLSKILANVFVDLVKFFIKILKDPGQDFHLFVRILKDLQSSCQDLQNSCQDLQGSLQIFKVLAKIFKDLAKVFKDLEKR